MMRNTQQSMAFGGLLSSISHGACLLAVMTTIMFAGAEDARAELITRTVGFQIGPHTLAGTDELFNFSSSHIENAVDIISISGGQVTTGDLGGTTANLEISVMLEGYSTSIKVYEEMLVDNNTIELSSLDADDFIDFGPVNIIGVLFEVDVDSVAGSGPPILTIPADTVFTIQTAVPEPSSLALLLGLGGVVLVLRRRGDPVTMRNLAKKTRQ